jgi:colanic acid biosynthesis protein WcaH|tara:strand:- start:125 stop:691 length:567 start_codon:yes stop_codon:yes gene_type:complete
MAETFEDIDRSIAVLEKSIDDPEVGLPERIFQFISRLTVMVNVDLLVKDDINRVLLSWRDTGWSGAGWHVPGGIIRYKENLEDRIKKAGLTEIGAEVDYDPNPVAINQIRKKHATRGHFLSILYNCSLPDDFIPENGSLSEKDSGYLKWHEGCPENLITVHDVLYREYIEAPMKGYFSGRIPYQSIDN